MREWVRSFEEYPFCIPSVRHLSLLKFHPKVTYFVGENGTGKSTLLEALAVALGLNPEGGSRNFNFATRESHSTLGRFLRGQAGRAARGRRRLLPPRRKFLQHGDGGGSGLRRDDAQPTRSYGEVGCTSNRTARPFFALLTTRFREYGLYLLDEPESALSPSRQLEHAYVCCTI